MAKMNREAWLTNYAAMLRPLFKKHGYKIPGNILCNMGTMPRRKAGLAFSKYASATETAEIFVSVHIQPDQIGHTLAHELVHVTVGNQHGHKGAFKTCAQAIGLTGKMTATIPTPALAAYLAELEAAMPPYPGQVLGGTLRRGPSIIGPGMGPSAGPSAGPSEPNRTIKLFCPGCKSVVTMKHKSHKRGVKVTCDNDDCERKGEEFQGRQW